MLSRAAQFLEPSGILVITVPNVGSLEAKLFGQYWQQWDIPRHLYHFDQQSLQRILYRGGFEERRVRTGVGTAFFMASLERAWTHGFGRALPGRNLVEK